MEQFSRRMAMARKYSTTIVAGAKGAPRVGSTHIFEHLLVVGLSPRGGQDPRILYQYPPGTSRKYCDINITPFCFPYGASTFLIRRSQSFTALNEVVFGQQSAAETAANSFVFLLNSGEELHYGVCVYSNELVSSLPSFADSEFYLTPPTSDLSAESPRSQSEEEVDLTRSDEGGSRRGSTDDDDETASLYSTFRCYCIVSKFPFFKAHFAVLYSLLAQERFIRMQSASLHDDPLQMVLKQKRLPPTPRHKGSVLRLLKQYYDTEVPVRAVSGQVQVPFEPEPVDVAIPAGHESLLLGDFGLACLFKMLPLEDILILFNAVLLEQKILIVSKNLGLLSKLVLSMISLLQPLVWQGTLIPVLPRSLMELLDSPVPYIFGVRSLSPEERSSVAESCFVLYCDKRKVTPPNGVALPALPAASKLESSLRAFHSSFRQSVGDLTRTTTDEEQIVRQILAAVRRYNRWLLEDLLLRSVTAETDIENPEHVEMLLRSTPPEYSTYMRALFHSQQFNVYATKIIARFAESADAVKTMLHKLNSMIDDTEGQIEATKEIIEIHTARLHEYQSKLEGCVLAKENLLQQITEGVSTSEHK